MKVGDYRDEEIPWRLTTRREMKAREILCEVKDCENVAIVKLRTRGPWLCSECAYKVKAVNELCP